MQLVRLPKGIYCPTCTGTDVTPVGRYRPTSGTRVRYFRCNTCAGRFKTTERLVGPLKPRNSSGAGEGS